MAVAARVLTIPELDSEPGLLHGFSTLVIGNVARALGIDAETLTVLGAVHGATVVRVDEPRDVIQGVDGLVTDRRGVSMFATFADCFPIVLWDPEKRCAALVHAGWRGTVAGVARAAVRAMAAEYGSKPSQIRAGIGPGICGRCYEVGDEVASRFESRFVTNGQGDRFLLDLAAANRAQLNEAGVEDVHVLGLCTKETSFLPSHRRSPDGSRFGAIVALR
ncbi:MAG: peptidoglycan editing factor PgeF [Chloroflexi bacterium]|nr:MAG: peptidoglycan editing factor PgeF [Chloroflexota bacterium]